jgi:putative glutamine amidotransferase
MLSPAERSVGGLDGLLLPGGWDLDPELYGEPPAPELGPVDRDLDEAEIDLVRKAHGEGLPVLGICRGQQVINVALGGTLVQHLPEHDVREHGRKHLAHTVRVAPGSELAAAVGGPELEVNSLHHQAVKEVAPGLTPAAFSEDGVIESLQDPDGSIVAVQCHPEELATDLAWAQTLFARFVARARRR